ncbi:MAG TPA: hypothetical protein V6C97_06485 [Oculatellaceae cyanobacterium]
MGKECTDHATAAAKPVNEFADLRANVEKAAYNLEHHQNNAGYSSSINGVLEEVYGNTLAGKSKAYKTAFNDFLDQKLAADGQLNTVADSFASENFEFLSNGKKRIQTADLAGKEQELGIMGKTIEQGFVANLITTQNDIEKAHHEGKFLGLGHKHGIDRARLDKYDQNQYDTNASIDVLRNVANPRDWDHLTGGTPYTMGSEQMNKAQLDTTIANGQNPYSPTPYVYPSQDRALNYVDDHFHKMSQTVPNYYGDERVVTLDSMTKYAKKHKVDWTTVLSQDKARNNYSYDISAATPQDYSFE